MSFLSKLHRFSPLKERELGPNLYPDAKPLEFNSSEPKILVNRKLHSLLDCQEQKRTINLSFYDLLYLREHPTERVNYDHRQPQVTEPDLEYIPDEELDQPASPAGDIRYMDIRCVVFPRWKATIFNRVNPVEEETDVVPDAPPNETRNEHHGRDSLSLPSQPETQAVPALPTDSTTGPAFDASESLTRFHFNQVPRELAAYLQPHPVNTWRSSTPTSHGSDEDAHPIGPAGPPSPAQSLSSLGTGWSLSSSAPAPELAPPLKAPVPDNDIPSLTPLTVRDVIEGIHTWVREPLDDDIWYNMHNMFYNILSAPTERRKTTPLDRRVKASEEAREHILADWLVDDVMFDGLVVTQVDGKGGMEAELLTRPPTPGELGWYRLLMRKRPHN